MGKSDTKSLLRFLKPFASNMQERALWLRDFVWELYPTANELIYDNYNALALGWSVTDRVGHLFCTIAVGRTSGNIHFGFYWGALIDDTKKLLIGNGNQYRYILVEAVDTFPRTYMRKLMKEAHSHSMSQVKDKSQIIQGKTIVKSVSAAKRVLSKKTVGVKPKTKSKSKK